MPGDVSSLMCDLSGAGGHTTLPRGPFLCGRAPPLSYKQRLAPQRLRHPSPLLQEWLCLPLLGWRLGLPPKMAVALPPAVREPQKLFRELFKKRGECVSVGVDDGHKCGIGQ